jgi:hypothetical protein
MAIVLGTNCGFVTAAPTADPAGNNFAADNRCLAVMDVTPPGTNRVTEMGIWIDNATQAANIQFALYSDAGANEPEVRRQVTGNIAKGTGGGAWVKATGLAWNIPPSTPCWLAIGMTDTATQTNTNNVTSGGTGYAGLTTATAPPADWGTSSTTDTDGFITIYAVYEPAKPVRAGNEFTKVTQGFIAWAKSNLTRLYQLAHA